MLCLNYIPFIYYIQHISNVLELRGKDTSTLRRFFIFGPSAPYLSPLIITIMGPQNILLHNWDLNT